MAAYAALSSLHYRLRRHEDDPNCIPFPDNVKGMIGDAKEQIQSTIYALEATDIDRFSIGVYTRMETWQLVESQLSNQFPFEFAIALALCRKVSPIFRLSRIRWKEVDVSDIGRIRDAAAACRLQHVLESLLSSLHRYNLLPRLEQQRWPQILLADQLYMAEQQILSFLQTAEKIIAEDGNNKSKNVVRLKDEFPQIMDNLVSEIEKHGKKMLTKIEDAIRKMSHVRRKRVGDVEVQIREAVCEIEDLIDTRLLNQFPVPFPMDLHEVQQYIPQFTQRLGNLKLEYLNELTSMLLEESGDNDDTISSSIMSYDKNKTKMVGLHDQFIKIRDDLFKSNSHLTIFVIRGMGGIGKTVLAKQVFDDPSILEMFELRVWVKFGQNFQLKRIKESILAQVMIGRPYNYIEGGDEERLDEYLHESLKGKGCLAVFDDVWDDTSNFEEVVRSLFPKDHKDGISRVCVILTTRLLIDCIRYKYQMPFMSNKESLELLCDKVFGEESLCPPLLKNAAKKFAENCEGLPLTIVTIGNLLSKVERTPEKWNELADNQDSLFKDAYDQMTEVMLPSYQFLSQQLKACFLYLGVFPRKYVISLSEVIKLWTTERLVELFLNKYRIGDIIATLFNDSLIMVRQKDLNWSYKTWSVHSAIRHLSKKEASKNKFSFVFECFGDSLSEDMKNQRRLCVHKNILFGIKDVRKSMESISTARSLLCTGPPHQYPVPICLNLKLLRILYALTIRLYEFPMDVLKLFQLKFLALTCYGNLPCQISKLGALETLIIRRHRSISSSSTDIVQSYLPVEIWDMKQLKHLQVMGSALPDPPCESTSFPNLETLLDCSGCSCNKRVFEGTRNLTKLGIRIELKPNGYATETLCCFDHIHRLKKLDTLKCVVVNPTLGPHIVPPTLQIFPLSLKKLTLSGFGYSWEDMRFVSSLPTLKCLKLRCYAFCGTDWEIKENEFPKLRYLIIEDADMVNLTVKTQSSERSLSIILRRCYKLESITFDEIENIEVYDCYEFRKPIDNYHWMDFCINNSGLDEEN